MAPSEAATAYFRSTDSPASSVRDVSGTSFAPGIFAAGHILAGRYRVIGLLGRGGMGEVYRADDLTLGTPVALKFLPPEAARDPAMLERFRAEVRIARTVAHTHVCRVYDIGEVDGRHFLSMEYVDGEDLATLLRRIGRLPSDKAVEIARQIAAGLAAAHEKGVLHRDLKPANVMIDGQGRARLTDFGLAVLTRDAAAEIAGTPAYMAPEQIAGLAATTQSDIYSLGLVLYELFTGKKPFEAQSLVEWREAHAETPPTAPSVHTADLDPSVERLILRCLEKDPARRPRSAAQVAMALPGGDPLAAAIAAGETPSPEMVAAAGGEGAISPRRAWMVLGAFFALLTAIFLISPNSTDLGLAPMTKSPEVLKDRARVIVQDLGYGREAGDEATWMRRDYDPIRWLADHLRSTEWRRSLDSFGPPVRFLYRRSAGALIPANRVGVVAEADPAPGPGEVRLAMDGRGRLRDFEATPERWASAVLDSASPFPVELVFRETGLDPARFHAVEPRSVPAVPFDERREWVGTRAEFPEIEWRLCVSAMHGRIVTVSTQGPWNGPGATSPLASSPSSRIGAPIITGLLTLLLLAGVYFVRRNTKLGRGDRRGAIRVAGVGFLLNAAWLIPGLHPTSNVLEFLGGPCVAVLSSALLSGATLWLIYMALEPFLRRTVPELLVGWARALDGRFRDPLVGREALYGLAIGALMAALYHLVNGLPTWIPFDSQTTIPLFGLDPGKANRLIPLSSPFGAASESVGRALGVLMTFFILRLFVSRKAILIAALTLISMAFGLGGENVLLETPLAFVLGLLTAWTIVELGPLTVGISNFVSQLLQSSPLRVAPSLWYAPYAVATWALLLGLAFWAFRTSLGGRSPFGALTRDA